jgi:hypothetical protein
MLRKRCPSWFKAGYPLFSYSSASHEGPSKGNMKTKITTLVENTVAQSGKNLIGAHGLSFYIRIP